MATNAPRRLPREARREQLVEAALEVAAERGFAALSLEDVAARAGVTRNLIYHYFPSGREGLILEAVEEAGRRLSDDWVVDEELPREQRLALNFGRVAEHAFTPTVEWQVYRQGRAYGDPATLERRTAYVDRVVSAIALNNTGSADPPPLMRMAITGFLAYAEVAFEEAREQGLDREAVLAVLARTLVATVAAAQDTQPG